MELNRVEKAQRFLSTMGAKALILCTKNQSNEEILKGLEEELLAKQEMQIEEDTKKFKRAMHLSPGVLVKKIGRSGATREVYIRYVKSDSNHSFGIIWKSSRMGFKKVFDVSQLTCPPVVTDDGYVRILNSKRDLHLKLDPDSQRLFLHHLRSLSLQTL
jgi:hypothetical protein